MNNGLKIILARMDTNPEEFKMYPSNSKWVALVDRFWDIFTDEEREAYQAKLREILGDDFSELILKELMEDPITGMKYKASDRYSLGWTDPNTLGSLSKAVSLSAAQVASANELGIPLEHYAKALSKQGL
jgi:hypothetical protein